MDDKGPNRHRKDVYAAKLHLTSLAAEGGYFFESYHNEMKIATPELEGGERELQATVYYIITQDGSKIGGMNHLNRLLSATVHCFHDGWPVKYTTISKDGVMKESVLGCDVENGQVPQLVVPPNHWKDGQILQDDKYARFPGETPFCLMSESVVPGFDIRDLEMATHENFKQEFPHFYEQVKHLILPK